MSLGTVKVVKTFDLDEMSGIVKSRDRVVAVGGGEGMNYC